MTVSKHSLIVANPDQFKISTYDPLSPTDARKIIKTELDKYNFAVNLAPINNDLINRFVGDNPQPTEVEADAATEGVVWVKCYYDETTNRGEIKRGKQVVFDTVAGDGVTGIHASWKTDEYKVVGIAMEDFNTVGTGEIPVKLIPLETPKDNLPVAFQVYYFEHAAPITLIDFLPADVNQDWKTIENVGTTTSPVIHPELIKRAAGTNGELELQSDDYWLCTMRASNVVLDTTSASAHLGDGTASGTPDWIRLDLRLETNPQTEYEGGVADTFWAHETMGKQSFTWGRGMGNSHTGSIFDQRVLPINRALNRIRVRGRLVKQGPFASLDKIRFYLSLGFMRVSG